jgi:hypothetical protein
MHSMSLMQCCCFLRADTHAISDIDKGRLPEWADKPAPDLAKFYWKMPKVCAQMAAFFVCCKTV